MKIPLSILCLLVFCTTVLSKYTLLAPEDVPPLQNYDELDCAYSNYRRHVDHPRAFGCDTKDYYNITLQPNHTVQNHFDLIGKDLSPYLLRRYEHGYITHLQNDTDMQLLRRDTGVLSFQSTMLVQVMPLNMSLPIKSVEFVRREFIEEPWDQFHPNWPAWPNEEIRKRLSPNTPVKLAEGVLRPLGPLTDEEKESQWAFPQENEFEVSLQAGHGLDDHFGIIGRWFPDERVKRVQREDPEYLQTAGYTILLEEGDVMRDLDAIRTDSGVRFVHQAVAWQAVRNENNDEISMEEAGKLPSDIPMCSS